MRIALLGGTGDIGEALALRWARDTDHDIIVGSRDRERAQEAAKRYESTLAASDTATTIEGASNPAAATDADIVILAIPARHISDTIETVADHLDKGIVVNPAVPLDRRDHGVRYDPPPAGSVTAQVARLVPDGVSVVGAYHCLPAARLADLDDALGMDVVLVGDDNGAKSTIAELTADIDGLRALDGGPIDNAPEVEALTAVVINLGQYTDRAHLGVRFV